MAFKKSMKMPARTASCILGFGLLSVALGLPGCNDAKSPEAVAKDVRAAEEKSAAEVAKSENAAAKDLNKAATGVDDKLIAFNNAAAKDAYNLAVAQADGDRKVALAQCNAMAGDAQKQCKDQAQANYEAARSIARADAVAEKR